MSTALKGQCLCGKTSITIENADSFTGQVLCHCSDCKHSSGSGFTTNFIAPQKDTKIEGPIKEYNSPAASGKNVTRIFCGNCGSTISHKSDSFGEGQVVQTGNFKHFEDKPVIAELFSKNRWSIFSATEGAAQQ